jgi:5'-3' exonuclease
MGVFRLFRYFLNKCPSIVTAIDKNKISNVPAIDILAIDLNAIFHPCCQKIFCYGQQPQNNSLLRQKKVEKPVLTPELIKKAYYEIVKKIDELVSINKPKQVLYLAIDGVAGLSKQTQQRQRRFRYAKIIDEKNFDSNSITVGTSFMENLSKFIAIHIERKLRDEWKHLNVIYSNQKVPGEGEHKLIHYIKKTPTYLSCSIVSPDADLIMLALATNRKGIYVFRDNIYSDFAGDYFFVSIDILRTYIIQNISIKRNIKPQSLLDTYNNFKNEIDYDCFIQDFVFFIFMLGNDFLPHIPSLEISNDGIEYLFMSYNKTINEFGYLTNNKKYTINYTAFKNLLKNLSEFEIKMLLDKSHHKVYMTDLILSNSLNYTKDGVLLNFDKYRKEYYEKKLKFEDENEIKNLVKEYVDGLTFILKYYYNEIPTYNWFFPYHYAPLLKDIYNYLPKQLDIKFEFFPALSPLEQLLCVLPPQSSNLLPECLRNLGEMRSMYPLTFTVDLEGKKNDYEGICILPFANVDIVKEVFKTKEKMLTEEDTKINKAGFIFEYYFNGKVVCKKIIN